MEDYEKNYADFWKDIVENPDGTLNIDQVKKELHDFYRAMQEVPKVYSHVTGGQLSKLLYEARTVIGEAERHYQDEFENTVSDYAANKLADDIVSVLIEDEYIEPANHVRAEIVDLVAAQIHETLDYVKSGEGV
jgi:hypothetical protein